MATKSKTSKTEHAAAVQDTDSKGKNTKPPQTKKQRLQALLCRRAGASLDALQKEFGWQPHTVHAVISGVRKAGNTVVCEAGKSGAVYRIVDASAVS